MSLYIVGAPDDADSDENVLESYLSSTLRVATELASVADFDPSVFARLTTESAAIWDTEDKRLPPAWCDGFVGEADALGARLYARFGPRMFCDQPTAERVAKCYPRLPSYETDASGKPEYTVIPAWWKVLEVADFLRKARAEGREVVND